MPEITTAERLLLDRYCVGYEKVERRSEREFDLSVEGAREMGIAGGPVRFSAWLPLAVIRDHPRGWSAEVFAMSDHPSMAGDWSAIRDSEKETIWRIFDYLTERGPALPSQHPKPSWHFSVNRDGSLSQR